MKPSPILGLSGHAGSGKNTVADIITSNYNATSIALADPLKRMLMSILPFDEEVLWGPSEFRNKEQYFNIPDYNNWTSKSELNRKLEIASDMYLEQEESLMIHKAFLSPTRAGIELAEWYLKNADGGKVSARALLQSLGSVLRAKSPDLWSNIATRNCYRLLTGETSYSRLSGIHNDKGKTTDLAIISDVRYRNETLNIKRGNGLVWRIVREGSEGDVGIKNHQSEKEMDSIPNTFYDRIITNNGSLKELEKKIKNYIDIDFYLCD